MKQRAEIGDEFFFLTTSVAGTSIRINSSWEYNHTRETKLFNMGNYFLTKQEAQEAKEKWEHVLNQ